MYEVGVIPGKFFPPHRGHLNQIIQDATKCKKLYVVVSDNENIARKKCVADGLPYISIRQRAIWMSQELKDFEHISVLTLYENDIPEYPDGSPQWCKMLCNLISPETINVIFGGELEYKDTYMKYLPGVVYELFDYPRSRYPISGTEIRHNYLKHWDYILGSARAFLTRRVLVTGTESCGKTTLTQYLAKLFYTSWSDEYGRYYPRDFLGNNDKLFASGDFERIAQIQQIQDEEAMRGANRVVIFDTDAVVTQYYCIMYTGFPNPRVEHHVDPDKYDVVLMLGPSTPWVPDGMRFKNDPDERWRLHHQLMEMYMNRGFGHKIIEINSPSYTDRLNKASEIVDRLIEDTKFMNRSVL